MTSETSGKIPGKSSGPVFRKLALWRFRRLFLSKATQLRKQWVLVALISSCLIPPASLSAFYASLARPAPSVTWLLVGGLGILLLFLQGQTDPGYVEILSFERTLPISRGCHLGLDLLDAFWIQGPVVFLVSLAGWIDHFEFHHSRGWSAHLRVLILLSGWIAMDFGLKRLLPARESSSGKKWGGRKDSLIQARLFWRNQKSRSSAMMIWILLLSALGWSIAVSGKSTQPRLGLFVVLQGLQLLPLAQIPEILMDWDADHQALLNTFPVTRSQLLMKSAAIYGVLGIGLLGQSLVWVAMSYPGLRVPLVYVLTGAGMGYLLLQLQLRVRHWAWIVGIPFLLVTAVVLQQVMI